MKNVTWSFSGSASPTSPNEFERVRRAVVVERDFESPSLRRALLCKRRVADAASSKAEDQPRTKPKRRNEQLFEFGDNVVQQWSSPHGNYINYGLMNIKQAIHKLIDTIPAYR